jgi:hypothetical protein
VVLALILLVWYAIRYAITSVRQNLATGLKPVTEDKQQEEVAVKVVQDAVQKHFDEKGIRAEVLPRLQA